MRLLHGSETTCCSIRDAFSRGSLTYSLRTGASFRCQCHRCLTNGRSMSLRTQCACAVCDCRADQPAWFCPRNALHATNTQAIVTRRLTTSAWSLSASALMGPHLISRPASHMASSAAVVDSLSCCSSSCTRCCRFASRPPCSARCPAGYGDSPCAPCSLHQTLLLQPAPELIKPRVGQMPDNWTHTMHAHVAVAQNNTGRREARARILLQN